MYGLFNGSIVEYIDIQEYRRDYAFIEYKSNHKYL